MVSDIEKILQSQNWVQKIPKPAPHKKTKYSTICKSSTESQTNSRTSSRTSNFTSNSSTLQSVMSCQEKILDFVLTEHSFLSLQLKLAVPYRALFRALRSESFKSKQVVPKVRVPAIPKAPFGQHNPMNDVKIIYRELEGRKKKNRRNSPRGNENSSSPFLITQVRHRRNLSFNK